jgi:hypothetical protein
MPSAWIGRVALRRCAWLLLALVGGLAAAAPDGAGDAAQAKRSLGQDYTEFKIISDRNIFNSNRSSRSAAAGEDRKPRQVDDLTLVGTLVYEKGPYAFFDGSAADYRKVLEPGKTIAGYKIAEINANSVKLESGTNSLELTVGMKLRREEEGDWELVKNSGPGTSLTSASSDTSSSASDEESDVVKRLMQQRERDLK